MTSTGKPYRRRLTHAPTRRRMTDMAYRTNLLTIQAVRARVRAATKLASDPEACHAAIDELATDVLRAIADTKCEDPRGCAKAFLAVRRIKMRWRACA